MGDVAELKELVSALVAENVRMSQESARREAEHADEIDKLIAALTQRPQQVVCCCSVALAVMENPSGKFPSGCRVSAGCENVGSSEKSSGKRGFHTG